VKAVDGALPVSVWADPPDNVAVQCRAAQLAAQLACPLAGELDAGGEEIVLAVTEARLELRVVKSGDPALCGGRAVGVELTKRDVVSGAGRRLSQPLARAIGRRRGKAAPTVLDATAGFGEDAFLLAALGCNVLAVERHPVVAALLRDGLERAAQTHAQVTERIKLVCADAIDILRNRSNCAVDPDVIYLDPMFPAGRKAAERKPMRVLRRLVGADDDAVKLFGHALQFARRRVVVKRPLHAPALGGKPMTTHKGKALRYDVYSAG